MVDFVKGLLTAIVAAVVIRLGGEALFSAVGL
jgi:hypothetical protein